MAMKMVRTSEDTFIDNVYHFAGTEFNYDEERCGPLAPHMAYVDAGMGPAPRASEPEQPSPPSWTTPGFAAEEQKRKLAFQKLAE